jgi:hypothetical protein
MEIKVKVFFKDYVKVGDEYKHIEVCRPFFCNTYDDLNSLIATLVDFSAGGSVLKFEVEKTLKEEE